MPAARQLFVFIAILPVKPMPRAFRYLKNRYNEMEPPFI